MHRIDLLLLKVYIHEETNPMKIIYCKHVNQFKKKTVIFKILKGMKIYNQYNVCSLYKKLVLIKIDWIVKRSTLNHNHNHTSILH